MNQETSLKLEGRHTILCAVFGAMIYDMFLNGPSFRKSKIIEPRCVRDIQSSENVMSIMKGSKKGLGNFVRACSHELQFASFIAALVRHSGGNVDAIAGTLCRIWHLCCPIVRSFKRAFHSACALPSLSSLTPNFVAVLSERRPRHHQRRAECVRRRLSVKKTVFGARERTPVRVGRSWQLIPFLVP